MKKLLLAIDGSENSLRAAETTLELLKLNSSLKATAVFVAPTCFDIFPEPGICTWINNDELEKEIEARASALREKVSGVFSPAGVFIEFVVTRGIPSEAICLKVEEENFDLVVIGSRGLGDVKSAILGSVSHKVLHCSQCPVMVVR